jgi:F0F1-type ATP synthase membrane subunit c/vacuolar-type H+-ATPase subunit K
MAPEQAAGRTEEVDERTDVFALGAMLYFVLAGTAPYQGPSGVAVLSAAIESNRVPIERAAPATAEGLRDILAIAMAKDPADRYPHAGAFADALQGFLDSKVRHASSPVLQAAGTAVGLLALVAGAVTGIIMSSSLSSFAEQGVSAWIYVVLTVVGGMLAILEWRTRGRNHFAPLILVFAAVTVLSGFASTMAGVGNILRGTIDMAPERGLLLFQRGFYELSGHVPVAVFAATLQLLAWALVRRQALITRDTENLAS